MTASQSSGAPNALDQERADIIETLQAHRRFLRYTVRA